MGRGPKPQRLADARIPLKKTVSDGTHTQTDGHGNLETKLAKWADSVKTYLAGN